MDTLTFAAERRDILTRSDDDLRPLVEDAFDARVNGEHDWSDDLVLGAQVLWLEIFEAESGRAPTDSEINDFQQRLMTSLDQTAPIENQFDIARINLTTTWVSTFTVNDATTTAADPGAELQWVTMHDPAVRASHVAADGQRVPAGSTFTVDGYELAFPGDPVGPPDVWINCRCVVAQVREDSEMTAQLTTDVALAAAAPVAEAPPDTEEEVEVEEIDDDVPGWDDDEIDVEVPWHGVIAPTGVKSGDRRRFTEGAMRFRDLPLPLRFQKTDAGGHDGSVVVANIERAWEEDGLIKAEGRFTLSPEADEAIGLIADGMLRGVSVDLDDVTVELQNEDGTAFDLDSDPNGAIENVIDGRVASAALVSIPAFQEAFVSLGTWEDDVTAVTASGCTPCAAREMDAYYDEVHEFAIAEGTWDGSASRFSDTEWIRSTIVDRGPGHDTAKERYAVPIREPNGDVNRAAVHNAAARIDQVDAPAAAIAQGKRKLVAAYRQLDEDPPESLTASAFADLTAEDQVDEVFAPGTRDGPGWITNPKETQRLRTYWTRGKGAAKIRWGQPGDFNRCRRQLAKYVPNPHYLAGTCANLHKVAMGIWPGQHAGKNKHSAETLTAAAPAFRVAGIEPEHVPPRAWFTDPGLAGPTPLTIEEDGRVFGHLALWDTCHVGLGLSVGDGPDCVTPPASPSGYASFLNKSILTDDGLVAVGTITMETGHAPGRLGAFPAAAHYDNTGTAAADVTAGEDEHGIWISGAVRPGTDVQALRGATLSGDWRTIGDHYELVAALAVNVPGFPIPRLAVAASGVSQALVAAGVVPPRVEAKIDTREVAKGIYTELTKISDRAQAREKLAAQMRAARRAELAATCAK